MKKIMIVLVGVVGVCNAYKHKVFNYTNEPIKVTANLIWAPNKSKIIQPNGSDAIDVVGWCTRGFNLKVMEGSLKDYAQSTKYKGFWCSSAFVYILPNNSSSALLLKNLGMTTNKAEKFIFVAIQQSIAQKNGIPADGDIKTMLLNPTKLGDILGKSGKEGDRARQKDATDVLGKEATAGKSEEEIDELFAKYLENQNNATDSKKMSDSVFPYPTKTK